MAATIEKLIEKLTSGIGNFYNDVSYIKIIWFLINFKSYNFHFYHFSDYNFLTDFFLTYRAFITPLQLCNLLILRFDWTLKIDDEQRRVVRVRYVSKSYLIFFIDIYNFFLSKI